MMNAMSGAREVLKTSDILVSRMGNAAGISETRLDDVHPAG